MFQFASDYIMYVIHKNISSINLKKKLERRFWRNVACEQLIVKKSWKMTVMNEVDITV